MKNFTQICFLITLISLIAFAASAQVNIRGSVTDSKNGEPLIGASIFVKESGEGTVTDYDGSFELRIKGDLPIVASVSYTGYEEQDVNITSASTKLVIKMEETAFTTSEIEIIGQRISEKQKASPLTVESLDLVAIKETASDNFYDGLGALKGVDLTAASLGFKIINTRGFNSTSPVRSLQIIDGVDNQAPGLNFSLGNFLGSSELDVVKVDMIQGASSAYYGPNAFNGVINMQTKDPFFQKGLSVMMKGGERSLFEGAIRWADAFKNKDGAEYFGYKFNFSYLRANDWVADNYNPVDDSRVTKDNPGRFDAVNIYGDEYNAVNDASTTAPWNDVGLGTYYRTGYREEDLVNYNTRNVKANAAFHLRTKPLLQEASPELILSSSFGNGTTVYQGDNRFSLRGILFFQNRLEYRKRDKFFVRAYATHEDAGNSYDPYFTALRLQQMAKPTDLWGLNYRKFWKDQKFQKRAEELGYPKLDLTQFPIPPFDTTAAMMWLQEYNDTLSYWHQLAANFANMADPNPPAGGVQTFDFFEPGTDRFNQAFNDIISRKSNSEENGTRFFDKSALYHVHGEYTFTPTFAEKIVLGGNGRLYRPQSDGTIFVDTAGIRISNYEFGIYSGIEKKFMDEKLTSSLTVRVDKNQNYDWISTPAASLVYKPRPNNYLRVSFSSAIRNPTLTDQYLNLDVGRATLLGNLNGFNDLITLESFRDYTSCLCLDTLVYFNAPPVQPEKVKTFEVGYRTTLFNSLYVDAGYYYSIYNDFLGYNIGIDAEFADNGLPLPGLKVYRLSANSTNRVTTQGFNIGTSFYFMNYYQLSGNYSWNKLNKTFEDDPIIPAFNTPEHKFNVSLSGRNVQVRLGNKYVKNFGFNINYKYVQGFVFEGSPQFTGFIPSYQLVDAQINYNAKSINTTFKLGASNILNNLHYETYGGPRIGRLAYFSVTYEFKKQ